MVRKASAEGWGTVHMTCRAQAIRGGSVVHQKREACIVPPVAPPGWVRCCRCSQALAVSMRGCGTTGEVLGYKRCDIGDVVASTTLLWVWYIAGDQKVCAYVRVHRRLRFATKAPTFS
jgi:hypothetical protein